MRSAPARGAGDRSGSPTSTLVLETEEVTHRISINHAVGCRGRLLHPDCRQMQEFVQNSRGHRLGSATLRIVELRAAKLRVANLFGSGTQQAVYDALAKTWISLS